MQQQTSRAVIVSEKKLIVGMLGLKDESKIVLDDGGWTSRVYMINSGEVVFKFPRSKEVKQEYELEKAAYGIAASLKSDILIPQLAWEHRDNDYLGYKGIPGRPLVKVVQDLSTAEKQRIGKRLGSFLKQLHGCEMEAAPTMTLNAEIEEIGHKFELGLPELKTNLTKSELGKVRNFAFREYPEGIKILGMDKGLCHGDLGFWNVIYREDGQIGIIDFGDIGYYDRSKDFAGMTDRVILEAALGEYGSNKPFRNKVDLRLKSVPVLDLPFFVGKKDKKGIARTVDRIREFLL